MMGAPTTDPSLSPWVIDTAAQQETTQGAGVPQAAGTQEAGRTTPPESKKTPQEESSPQEARTTAAEAAVTQQSSPKVNSKVSSKLNRWVKR
jgi:hypothetical protein